MKKALITGASSGIGRDIARYLSQKGYSLILTARREDRLNELDAELKTPCRIIPMDISARENCFKLYEMTKQENIDIFVNNAGFGVCGEFDKTALPQALRQALFFRATMPLKIMLFGFPRLCTRNSGAEKAM